MLLKILPLFGQITLWNFNTENLNSTENLCNCTENLIQKKYTLKEHWKSHWKFVFVI